MGTVAEGIDRPRFATDFLMSAIGRKQTLADAFSAQKPAVSQFSAFECPLSTQSGQLQYNAPVRDIILHLCKELKLGGIRDRGI